MKRLYVCGSFKFLREIEELECKLKEKNIKYETTKKMKHARRRMTHLNRY